MTYKQLSEAALENMHVKVNKCGGHRILFKLVGISFSVCGFLRFRQIRLDRWFGLVIAYCCFCANDELL